MAEIWKSNNLMYATTLQVYKYTNGLLDSGYPVTHSILAAFGAYPAITADAWQKSEEAYRNGRIAAMRTYAASVHGVTIANVEVNVPVYETEPEPDPDPWQRQILIYGTLPMQTGVFELLIAHGSVQDYHANPLAYSLIAREPRDVTETHGAFGLIWEVTEEEYERSERPWILALVEGEVFKVVPKPSFADAVANGITFDDGSDWEGLA